MLSLLPIRKVVVTALGAGLTWAALRLGLDLGSDAANEAATVLVGLAFGYLERDPRVIAIEKDVENVLSRVDWSQHLDEPGSDGDKSIPLEPAVGS